MKKFLFIESDYQDINELLAIEEPSVPQNNYVQIKVEELMNGQLHDILCSDIRL